MYIFKNKSYETLLEAVDASYCDNGIFDFQDTLEFWEDRLTNEDLELISEENYYDLEVGRIKTKDALLKEFEIKEIANDIK